MPMETVFCRRKIFLGGLINVQKEENQLKTSLAMKGFHLQEPMKILPESKPRVFKSSFKYQTVLED